MPHLFCLPYQLAGWDADYPARRCPTRHPRPGGRLSAIDRRRGRSLGVGFQHGLLKSPPRSVPWGSCGRTLPTCRRKNSLRDHNAQLASSQRSCGLRLPPSLRRKIWHHIEASTVLPPQSRHLAAWRAKLIARPQRAWARSIFTPQASEDESYSRKLLGQCCRWANSYEPQAGFGGFRQ